MITPTKSKLLFLFCFFALLATPTGWAREYHVSVRGNDSGEGTKGAPFRTIGQAADLAQPGDIITVHEGIYREEIAPPRGGTSDEERIVYRAAPGEKVSIRGSEVVEGWVKEGGVWKIEISNDLFGDFNPFADKISGDWFKDKGRDHHTGCVYIDGEWLFEAASREEVPEAKWPNAFYAEVNTDKTVVWAVFDDRDPNNAVIEVNVRQTVFYPRKPFINYITVRGFDLRHAAPKWAPPTAEQMGLIGTHWSKGWIIEKNNIKHSINAGLSLGKYGDEYDNVAGTAAAYLASIDRARDTMKWNKEHIGSHIVRNNEISYCEQIGIVGSMGASFSQIIGNHVHHIHIQARYTGAEMAGIKFHAPIDMLIKDNRINNSGRALWLDWMTQGTRVTGNLCYNNGGDDCFMEVNHGPCVIDNNLFLSRIFRNRSQGMAYAHNLFAGEYDQWLDIARATPYFTAHSTVKVADHKIDVADMAMYNNIFVGRNTAGPTKSGINLMEATAPKKGKRIIGYGTWMYDEMPTPLNAAGNAYYHGAKGTLAEEPALVSAEDPGIQVIEEGDAVYLEMTLPESLGQGPMVTTERLGKAVVPDLPYLDFDGSLIKLDADYFRNPRGIKPTPGPFENPGSGKIKLKVWPK
ncbi:MAG: right-handed parallel beta-helix repeat-containing protein [Verrucomicrobiota bacterium]